MKLAIAKTPKLVQWFFHKRVWAFARSSNTVYLTFDDGPIPEITPWVLGELKKHNAKATFFCIGDNIKKYPLIFDQVINGGHAIGNHTQHHVNGWEINTKEYLEEVALFEKAVNNQVRITSDERRTTNERNKVTKAINSSLEIQKSTIKNPQSKIVDLFRPPYGKMTSKQAKTILEKGYKIIMWDILSKDYDISVNKETCLNNVLRNIKPGSIVVFHDSLKAQKNLKYVLPKVLEFINQKGWKCASIQFS